MAIVSFAPTNASGIIALCTNIYISVNYWKKSTLTVQLSRSTHLNMKFSFGKAHVSLLLLALLVFISLPSGSVAQACDPVNCVTRNKCDILMGEGRCSKPDTVCCSVLKPSARTHCRHHGGECMRSCATKLQRPVVDCKAGTVCCVLVG